MKYARRRISSSEGSPGAGAGSACGDAEIRVVPPVIPFAAAGLRDFLTVLARCPLWRLPVFLFPPGAPDSADD
jgi:hypothetical protein